MERGKKSDPVCRVLVCDPDDVLEWGSLLNQRIGSVRTDVTMLTVESVQVPPVGAHDVTEGVENPSVHTSRAQLKLLRGERAAEIQPRARRPGVVTEGNLHRVKLLATRHRGKPH